MPANLDPATYMPFCDSQSSTDPRDSTAIPQPIDPRIIARPAGTPDETWFAFLRTLSKNGTPVEVIEAAEEKRKANPIVPEWMKEPEYNPALQAPPIDKTYSIRLDASRFANDTEAAIANKAIQDEYRRVGLPAAVASGFTQTLQETNAQLAGLEGEERAAYLEGQHTTLVRTYGQARAQTMLDKADRMAKQLGSSSFVEAVGGPDAFHSAMSIVSAANAYDLMHYRKGK